MPILKREHAKQHCRTCLVNIKPKHRHKGINSNNNNVARISITNNKELAAIIRKYVDLRATDYIKDYPQFVCTACFNKLQSIDRFCKRAQSNAEKLHEILNGNEFKEEIEYDSDDPTVDLTSQKDNWNDDSLMETESVFFNNPSPDAVVAIDDEVPIVIPKVETITDDDKEKIKNKKNKNKKDGDKKDDFDNFDNDDNIDFNFDDEKNDDNDDDDENTFSLYETSTEYSFNDGEDVAEVSSQDNNTSKDGEQRGRKVGFTNRFKCDQCNNRFAYKSTLNAHIRLVHEGNANPYKCEHCDKSFSYIGELYNHLKEEHNTISFACDMPGCDRSYTSAKGLSTHKRIKHSMEDIPEDVKFMCELCGMAFSQNYNLRNHYRNKHPTPEQIAALEEKKKSFECKICKRFFHSQYTLKYHNMQQHTNDMKKFECNICGRKHAKKFMLVAHMLVHSGPKTPCEHCGRLFIRKFELKEHIRAVHLKLRPFHCRYCPESFACRKTVKHHEYIHTGEKPYVCEVCGQAYRQRSCLKNHRKVHENQIPPAVQPQESTINDVNNELLQTFTQETSSSLNMVNSILQ